MTDDDTTRGSGPAEGRDRPETPAGDVAPGQAAPEPATPGRATPQPGTPGQAMTEPETPGRASGPATPGPANDAVSPRPASFFSDFVELVYGVFFSPTATLRDVARRPTSPVGVCLFAFLVSVLINGLAGAATSRAALQQIFSALSETGGFPAGTDIGSVSGGFVATTAILALLWGPVGLFFKTGALNLMSSFLGGRGDGSRLYAAFGLTYVPSLLSVPVSLLISVRPGLGQLGFALTMGILIWRLVLDIIAIREVHDFGTGKAVAAALVPLGVLILLVILAVLVWLVSVAALLGPMMQSGIPGVG